MSRRDTIIIAVLLNAGLLIVLFATSLKSDRIEQESLPITVLATNKPEVKESSSSLRQPKPKVATPSTDPVDRVIQQYVTPQLTTTPDTQPNFLADLQAIGSPSGTSTTSPDTEMGSAATSTGSDANFKEVRVKKGDVLERIARQNHVTVSEIMKVNRLTSTRLKIGQILKVPVKESLAFLSPTSSVEDHYYIVKTGDNPWTIAVKHHMKVEELLRLNDLDEEKAKRLKAGDKIRIK